MVETNTKLCLTEILDAISTDKSCMMRAGKLADYKQKGLESQDSVKLVSNIRKFPNNFLTWKLFSISLFEVILNPLSASVPLPYPRP